MRDKEENCVQIEKEATEATADFGAVLARLVDDFQESFPPSFRSEPS